MGEPENIGSGTYDPSRWKDSVYIDKLVTSQSFIKYLILKLACTVVDATDNRLIFPILERNILCNMYFNTFVYCLLVYLAQHLRSVLLLFLRTRYVAVKRGMNKFREKWKMFIAIPAMVQQKL